jgi:hypothetical protein
LVQHYQARGVFREPAQNGRWFRRIGTYTAIAPVLLLVLAGIVVIVFSARYLACC